MVALARQLGMDEHATREAGLAGLVAAGLIVVGTKGSTSLALLAGGFIMARVVLANIVGMIEVATSDSSNPMGGFEIPGQPGMMPGGMNLGLRIAFAALCLALGLAGRAAQAECRLALVLALDVSSSVDEKEYELQRIGLAAALDAPEVRHAILEGAPGYVALSVFEWSGFHQHKIQLEWTDLRSHSDIDRAIASLAAMERSHDDFPTSIGPALGFASQVLADAPHCVRKVIDVSGDGVNNYRFGPREAYRHFPLADVTVNGLVILGDDPSVFEYYGREVLHGPGAFLMVANGFEEYRVAMTRKLFREVNDIMLGAAPTAAPGSRG